ncbi:MAG: endopeptidase La, partial [Candidatus Rokuibacteriota bacterium]
MSEKQGVTVPDVLAILPLRDTVLFPQAVLPLSAGRPASLRLVDEAVRAGRVIGVVTQRDAAEDEPGPRGLHTVGVVTVIHKVAKQSDGTVRLVVQGLSRFRILEVLQTEPFIKARIEQIPEPSGAPTDLESEALMRSAVTLFQKIVALSPMLPDEAASLPANILQPGALADVVAAALPTLKTAFKQEVLETSDVKLRLQKVVAALT